MLTYLQKYSQLLPAEKQKFSSPEFLATIKNLEAKYQVNLGILVMKIVVGEVAPGQIIGAVMRDWGLPLARAQALASELTASLPLNSNQQTSLQEKQVKSVLPPYQGGRQKGVELAPTDAATSDLEAKVKNIMAKAKVNFPSQDLTDRFSKILFTYVKGIRNNISAKETLMKPVESGGLGLDAKTAENILALAKEPVVVPMAIVAKKPAFWEKAEMARDVEYDLAASIKARQAKQNTPPPSEGEGRGGVLLEPPVPVVTPIIENKKPVANVPAPAPAINNLRKTDTGKIRMDDVMAAPPRAFTPVDELKYMTIRNFRNLSQEPDKAVEIIKKKLVTLGEEDYSQKVAGIQGWRMNPVNKMYVAVYHEAMTTGNSVDKILASRRKAEPDFLTDAEFAAIINFNQEIKSMIN